MKAIFQSLMVNGSPHNVGAHEETAATERSAKGKGENFTSLLSLFLREQPVAVDEEDEEQQSKARHCLYLAAFPTSVFHVVQDGLEEGEDVALVARESAAVVEKAAVRPTKGGITSQALQAAQTSQAGQEELEVSTPELREVSQPKIPQTEASLRGEIIGDKVNGATVDESLSVGDFEFQAEPPTTVLEQGKIAIRDTAEYVPIVVDQLSTDGWELALEGDLETELVPKSPDGTDENFYPGQDLAAKTIAPGPEVAIVVETQPEKAITRVPTDEEMIEGLLVDPEGPIVVIDETVAEDLKDHTPIDLIANGTRFPRHRVSAEEMPTAVQASRVETTTPQLARSLGEKGPEQVPAPENTPDLPKAENTEQEPEQVISEQRRSGQAKEPFAPKQTERTDLSREVGLESTNFHSKPLVEERAFSPAKTNAVLDLQSKHDLLPKLTQHIRTLVDGERSEVRIQLKPDHLGDMRIKLSLERGVMVAEFMVENEAVREVINSNLSQLHTALQDQGANIAEMTVNIGFGQEGQGHDLPQRAKQFAGNSRLGSTAVKGESSSERASSPWHQVDLRA